MKSKSINFIKPFSLPCTLVMACLLVGSLSVQAQETLLSGLKNNSKRADDLFDKKEYKNALDLYIDLVNSGRNDKVIYLQLARTTYHLNDFAQAVQWYNKHLTLNEELPPDDMLKYAEALKSIKNYKEAITWYTAYHSLMNDELTMNKIWRLKNMQYMYEDSSFYTIRPIEINSSFGELGAVRKGDGLVFMSNRNTYSIIDRKNSKDNSSFYKLYYSKILEDTVASGSTQYQKPVPFSKELKAKYHEGPVSFYDDDKKMIYTTILNRGSNSNSNHVLQLYFAELKGKRWILTKPYPFNSDAYSLNQPSMSKDGMTLYFSSDMKGGFGKWDLYKSDYKNGQWTKPVNLGDLINTREDESFPFIHNQTTLYFSSNGHPGLGGLDILRVDVTNNLIGEIQNVGYPINTNFDEFGIDLNKEGSQGFFTSNRKRGTLDDDIYELKINLQSYPLQLSGLLKYKMNNWNDSTALKILPQARLFVIDNVKNSVVYSTISDEQGRFTFVIPYFSRYKIRVVDNDGIETSVSLDISKERKLESNYEIVVVKDRFKSKSKNDR